MKALLFTVLFAQFALFGAASFNGTSQAASTTGSLVYGTNLITISYYLRHERTNETILAESSSTVGGNQHTWACVASQSGTGPERWVVNGTSILIKTNAGPLVLNEIQHRVVVIDKTTTTGDVRVYTNGIASATGVASGFTSVGSAANFNSHRLYLGARDGGVSRFKGLFQDFAVYSGEVSSDEAYALGAQRMSPLKVRSAKLLYYWPFSDGENPSNSPDLIGGVPVNSGTKSIVSDQAPAYRK